MVAELQAASNYVDVRDTAPAATITPAVASTAAAEAASLASAAPATGGPQA